MYFFMQMMICVCMYNVSVRIAWGLGGWTSYLILPTPYLWLKFDPGGRVSTPLPPKFCWSWYAAWFTLPSNAVLKISTVWWFECYYYFNSYWRLGVSSPGLSVKFVLRTLICNNDKKSNLLLPLLKYWTVKVIAVMIKFSKYKTDEILKIIMWSELF